MKDDEPPLYLDVKSEHGSLRAKPRQAKLGVKFLIVPRSGDCRMIEPAAPVTTKICERCGTSYTPRQAHQKFCSHHCGSQHHEAKRRPLRLIEPPCELRTCKRCGTRFAPSRASQRYCSNRCKERAQSARRKRVRA
jgi:hypothetical protein